MGEYGQVQDVVALEEELRRIPGVAAARIVLDPDSRPIEVHVLASTAKHPKQVVRDIQSVAKAGFDVDVDRRINSVVQLDGPILAGADQPADDSTSERGQSTDPRIAVDGVAVTRSGPRATAEVRLGRGGAQALGKAEGAASTYLLPALVARATLDALSYLEPNAARLELEAASVHQLAERSMATVSLVLLGSTNEEPLVGTAAVRGVGREDAIVRAVLDATNRRLGFA